jgi:hypothetical protein
MLHTELQPGQQAPATGRYQALNVFGSPDQIISISAGDRLRICLVASRGGICAPNFPNTGAVEVGRGPFRGPFPAIRPVDVLFATELLEKFSTFAIC